MRPTPVLAALTLTVLSLATPWLDAANGSNYVHLINGIDQFVQGGATSGGFRGVWRCFPGDMLHAPTLSVGGPQAGTYATKIRALHLNVTASPGSTIRFPAISLTSSLGKCKFLTSAGQPNFGVFPVQGLGNVVAGPLTGNAGPVMVNLLAGLAGVALPNPASAPNVVVSVLLDLDVALGQTVDVPVGESLVLWVQDDPSQPGAGTRQYWTASVDERNLCSSYSFLLSSAGTQFQLAKTEEWGIGFGTVDATLTTAIRSVGSGSVHAASHGFNPGFDAGSGTRTVSIGGAGGAEFLAFNVYDEAGASFRLGAVNCAGFDSIGASCAKRSPSFVPLPSGGPGGPVLAGGPQKPRMVGKIDVCTQGAWSSPLWIASTNFQTAPGGNNVPFLPLPAGNGGSNAGGNVGGFPLPIGSLTALVGAELYFWSLNVDPTNSFLDPIAGSGHKLTNGYPVLFFP